MYLCTYEYEGKENVGIMIKDNVSIIPINKLIDESINDMNEFISIYSDKMVFLKKKVNEYSGNLISLNDVKVSSPIRYPRRDILCLGKNYKDHALEIKDFVKNKELIPKYPIYFTKRADRTIGTGDTILRHEQITNEIDYEVELAVIIGKDGINIDEKDVDEYIFGYTIVNDVSARDIQRKHEQWFRGKSLQTFCPMGPYIVTKDDIPFPVALDIACKVNDELRQSSNTKNMIFDIPHIISEVSKGIELKTGDIIITGTPSGVGLGFNPPKYLKAGDKIECTIEKIGTLVNYME
ncbi:fumarylacetoacetate hydrolase family protein [Vallitalea guaymasensis]|uniref:fumarylacetoacetate hydrolase family protein n=1 Tax=Vallitalea guaymasensis TaxID=1185412 RepID=UPI00272A064B|nr:fumarylacetoacetate hydrolase family protein [Vallitalea guaymasensis]